MIHNPQPPSPTDSWYLGKNMIDASFLVIRLKPTAQRYISSPGAILISLADHLKTTNPERGGHSGFYLK